MIMVLITVMIIAIYDNDDQFGFNAKTPNMKIAVKRNNCQHQIR